MQQSTTNVDDDDHLPFKLNIFLFGHEHKQFHKYSHQSIKSRFSAADNDDSDDDDDELILSGRNCLLYIAVKYALLMFFFSSCLPTVVTPAKFVFISIYSLFFLLTFSILLFFIDARIHL